MIVGRVLHRVMSGQQQEQQLSKSPIKSSKGAGRAVVKKCWSEDDNNSNNNKMDELECALNLERQKSLEWMERHNRERDARRLAEAEMDAASRRMEAAAARADAEREELGQVQHLYEEERAQAAIMEEALRYAQYVRVHGCVT